jgi:hypothetical protein
MACSQLQHGIQLGHVPEHPAKTALTQGTGKHVNTPMHGNTGDTLPTRCSTQHQATNHMGAKCVVCCTAGSSHAGREASHELHKIAVPQETTDCQTHKRHVHAKKMARQHTVKGVLCTDRSANFFP